MKSGRYCDRSETEISVHQFAAGGSPNTPSPASKFPPPDDPRKGLSNPNIARYFHHYITQIAPWYDLSDYSTRFGTQVPRLALDDELLFSAILALSAIHVANTTAPTARVAAEFYHSCCVRLLIGLDDSALTDKGGIALATTCLLRSYEILAEEEDPNRHLQGAYSLASQQKLLLDRPDDRLVAAGFWNYLREDITFSLFTERPLKIDLDSVPPLHGITADHCYVNSISLILGRIINTVFGTEGVEQRWPDLYGQVQDWRANLPKHIGPFSRMEGLGSAPLRLPVVWMLHDAHAAALHYHLVSMSILSVYASDIQIADILQTTGDSAASRPTLLERYALEICGIAFTASSSPVIVNAFGPMAYCGRFIQAEASRQELIRRLHSCKTSTGWPVHRIIKGLEAAWESSDQGSGAEGRDVDR